METLNDLYRRLLEMGLLELRDSILRRDSKRSEVEVDFLHNIPSLIGESNRKRHHYFWFCERPAYLDWVGSAGPDVATSPMLKSVLQEMEPVMLEFLESAVGSEQLHAN